MTVTNGASVNFSVTAAGSDLSYQWTHDGAVISGETSSVLTLVAVSQEDAGDYHVSITNAVGSVTSSPATLTVLELPTIAPIDDQSTDEDTPLQIALTIGDLETPATALAVTASSDNQVLVPNANLQISDGGSNRTLTISPALNQFGSALITVTVTDEDGLSAQSAFTLTVNSVLDLPIITQQPQERHRAVGNRCDI